MTKAEALGLRWDDVDFENRIIHITHAAKYRPGTDDKARWMITEPKTKAGIRGIPMIDQVYDALKAEYKVQQERGFPTPTISGMTGFIFVNEESRLRSPEAINRAIDTITRWCNKEEEQKGRTKSSGRKQRTHYHPSFQLPRFSPYVLHTVLRK